MKKSLVLIVISLMLVSCNKNDAVNLNVTEPKSVETNVDTEVSEEKDDLVVEVNEHIDCITSVYNIDNYGIATHYSNMLIYTDFKEKALVGLDLDTDKKITISEKMYLDLQVYDGWIYGSAFDDDGQFYVTKVRPNGTDEKRIIESGIGKFHIVDDEIIYVKDNGSIFSLSLLNGKSQLIHNTNLYYVDITIHKGFIYYYNYEVDNVVRIPIDGGEVEKVLHQDLQSFIVDDKGLYYLTDEGIYLFDSINNTHNLIVEGGVSSFNIINEVVYYGDFLDMTGYKYDMTSKKREAIIEGRIDKISIVCNYLLHVSYNDGVTFTNIIKLDD